MKVYRSVSLIAILSLVMILGVLGCGSPTAPTNQGDHDVGLPLDFPLYPGAQLVESWDNPYPHYVFSAETDCEGLTEFFLRELRESGWYVASGLCTGFVCAEDSCNIYVVDARKELIAVIVLYSDADQREYDGYTIMYGVDVVDRAERVANRQDIDGPTPQNVPIYPESYLVERLESADSVTTDYHYRVEYDCACADLDIEDTVSFFDEQLPQMGWSEPIGTSFGDIYTLEATRNGQSLRLVIDKWTAAGITIGARIAYSIVGE